jgi:hypothetical protein
MHWQHRLDRRQLLKATAAAGAGFALTPLLGRATPGVRGWVPARVAQEEAQAIVGDVLDFRLESEGMWEGPFGWVTLRLHRGLHDGNEAWFIRTDASDMPFARREGLVWVPIMANALNAPGSYGDIYLFEGGADGQAPVLSTVPGRDDFTSAFRVHYVRFQGAPRLLTSRDEIRQAQGVSIEDTNVIVNYPLVSWAGGALPADPELKAPLGKGPLIEEPDLAGGTVTFKLHQCFPGSRYIVTDTSAVPMAPMMGVVGSAPTQLLKDARATAPITIFLNGLRGPGVMGFQPAIFNTKTGEPAWSPFWDHFAVRWQEPSRAAVLRSQVEIEQRVAAGELERFNGVPDTHPNGFVVNCPSPVLAPNTYQPG